MNPHQKAKRTAKMARRRENEADRVLSRDAEPPVLRCIDATGPQRRAAAAALEHGPDVALGLAALLSVRGRR